MNDNYEEIPKYKKKKDSSSSKSKEKSKHKHQYIQCILTSPKSHFTYKGEYCKVCGKLNSINILIENFKNGQIATLSLEEACKKYEGLEVIEVDDIWQKYIPVSKEVK